MALELLDIRTIIFFLALGHLITAILFYFDTRKHALRYDILFMLALGAQCTAWSLIFLRGFVPIVFSFYIGNTFFLIGLAIQGISLLSLVIEVTKRWRIFFISLLTVVIIMWWLPIFEPHSRIAMVSMIVPLFLGVPAFYMIRKRSKPSPLQLFTGVILMMSSIILAGRGAYMLQADKYELVFSTLFQLAALIIQAIIMIIVCTSYILIRREAMYKELEKLALTDPLTKVDNRRAFLDKGAQELRRSKRNEHYFSLIMIDVDHFKEVNDRYGHYGGDIVLKALASKSKKVLRKTDLFGRLGGEEFVAILPEASEKTAIAAAERLRKEISNMQVDIDAKNHIQVTVSIGLTVMTNKDETLLEIMNRADAALYDAKDAGRNRVVLA